MIAKILPQAESYYHQNLNKDTVIAKQEIIIDKQSVALANTDVREIKYLDQLKIKDQEIQAVKPSWLQHPIAITGYVFVAFIIGVFVGK